MYFTLAALFLFSIPPWLTVCSRQRHRLEDFDSFELTSQSISEFIKELREDTAGSLAAELRESLAKSDTHEKLCLKYLIGSVAVFGRVGKDVLLILRGFSLSLEVRHLHCLVCDLYLEDCSNTIVQFTKRRIGRCRFNLAIPFVDLLVKLAGENWNVMGTLFMGVLNNIRDDIEQRCMYQSMLRRLSVEQQYWLINSSHTPLVMVDDLCSMCEFDPLLRELVVSEQCIRSLEQRILNFDAEQFPHTRRLLDSRPKDNSVVQSRPDDTSALNGGIWHSAFKYLGVAKLFALQFRPKNQSAVPSCPSGILALNGDALHCIFEYLDAAALFGLPLVCKSWGKLYPEIMRHDARSLGMYVRDLDYFGLHYIHEVAPWRYCLRSKRAAFKNLGWCILNGALEGIESTGRLECELDHYVRAMADAKSLLPELGDCAAETLFPRIKSCTLYESFRRLLEKIYGSRIGRPTLNKPDFLTNEEYEQIIHYLVCEKRLFPRLSDSILDDLPKLFDIVDRNGQLMRKLTRKNFCSLDHLSIIVLMYGQMNSDPDTELLRAVFSQTGTFKRLIEPNTVDPSEYYSFIVESGIFHDVVMNSWETISLCTLITSVILFFKNDQSKTAKIMSQTITLVWNCNSTAMGYLRILMKERLERGLSQTQSGSGKLSPEDAEFIKGTMMEYGLSIHSK